ncbi:MULTISPECIES: hypothetical protein [Streptomyces]|nr:MULTISPECIES: hypothetical protein [Streptomyces]MDI5912608.1 hypothetical protein [Streptomyces sp. 12257]
MSCSEPSQRGRLVEIRDSLLAGITKAELDGWFGEVEASKSPW